MRQILREARIIIPFLFNTFVVSLYDMESPDAYKKGGGEIPSWKERVLSQSSAEGSEAMKARKIIDAALSKIEGHKDNEDKNQEAVRACQTFLNKADALIANSMYEAARPLYEMVLELAKKDYIHTQPGINLIRNAQYRLGIILDREGKIIEARRIFNQSAEFDEDYGSFLSDQQHDYVQTYIQQVGRAVVMYARVFGKHLPENSSDLNQKESDILRAAFSLTQAGVGLDWELLYSGILEEWLLNKAYVENLKKLAKSGINVGSEYQGQKTGDVEDPRNFPPEKIADNEFVDVMILLQDAGVALDGPLIAQIDLQRVKQGNFPYTNKQYRDVLNTMRSVELADKLIR